MDFSFSKIFFALMFQLFLMQFTGFAQEVYINQQLRLIESGETARAKEALQTLFKEHPKDPSVLYLDALLTTDANEAVSKYSVIMDRYPQSRYAGASIYKIYSYYYAQGLYTTSRAYLDRLKKNYPDSPYISLAEKKTDAEIRAGNDTQIELPKPEVKPSHLKAEPKFTIQAGAFINLINAQRIKNSFVAEGYTSDIKQKNVAGTTLNVLNVGSFVTEDEARAVLLQINERYKLNGRVIPLDEK
ncbi:MAG: SPOR domain-containing protein [Ignavibacteria bacterium]